MFSDDLINFYDVFDINAMKMPLLTVISLWCHFIHLGLHGVTSNLVSLIASDDKTTTWMLNVETKTLENSSQYNTLQ